MASSRGPLSPCTVSLNRNLLSVLHICELQSATYHATQKLWPETCYEWFSQRVCFTESTFAEAGTEGHSGATAAAADMNQVEAALSSFLSEVAISSTMYRDELLAACLELLLAGMSHHTGLLQTQARGNSTASYARHLLL